MSSPAYPLAALDAVVRGVMSSQAYAGLPPALDTVVRGVRVPSGILPYRFLWKS